MITTFGRMPDGQSVERILLQNATLKVGLISLGASVQSVEFNGAQVTIGSDALDDYLGHLSYAGAIVGRVANRIAAGRAEIGGALVQLDANEDIGNCLHGGSHGAAVSVWEVKESGATHAVFTLHMPDGHMGFPGALDVEVRYELKGAALCVEISATSDAETLCSFAPHSYWNLSGKGTINDHTLRISAQSYLPLNDRRIPLGAPADVAGGMFDYRCERVIGTAALDNNFCLSREREAIRPVVWLHSAKSGISLEVASTEAGVQIFDARHFGRTGLAIEPQVWPDAVNQRGYPKISLSVGETYRANTEFRFYSAV